MVGLRRQVFEDQGRNAVRGPLGMLVCRCNAMVAKLAVRVVTWKRSIKEYCQMISTCMIIVCGVAARFT